MIRHAKPEDADSCIHLMKLVKNDFPGYREDAFRTALQEMIERGEAFVSQDDDMLEGMVGFSREKKALTMLAVHPDCRREGIATRLIYTVAGCFEPEDEISVITFAENDPRGEAARAEKKRRALRQAEARKDASAARETACTAHSRTRRPAYC